MWHTRPFGSKTNQGNLYLLFEFCDFSVAVIATFCCLLLLLLSFFIYFFPTATSCRSTSCAKYVSKEIDLRQQQHEQRQQTTNNKSNISNKYV